MEDINSFEKYVTQNWDRDIGKFSECSKKEQKKRFLERLDNPEKNWKFSAADVKERKCWDDYQSAYEKMIRNTASGHAPWVVVRGQQVVQRLLVAATGRGCANRR